jgi:FPC/CPF motif-containing protein YcgG
MFIIAVLKKPEEANIQQNFRSALSALLRESLFHTNSGIQETIIIDRRSFNPLPVFAGISNFLINKRFH